MKSRWRQSSLTLVLCFCAFLADAGEVYRLSPDGYGPAHIGMTVDQASTALGMPLVTAQDETPNPDCYHVHPRNGPVELYFMIQQGRIVRVSLYEGPSAIRTDRGIGLGDTIDKVRKAYGPNLRDEPHEYLGPTGRYLTSWDERRKRGIRFEINTDGKVDTIHAGGEAIELVEGCS